MMSPHNTWDNEVGERMRTGKYTVRCYKAKEICITLYKSSIRNNFETWVCGYVRRKRKSEFTNIESIQKQVTHLLIVTYTLKFMVTEE